MKIRHHQRKIFFAFIKSVFKPKDSGFAGFRSTVLPVNIIPIYPVHTSSLDVILRVYLSHIIHVLALNSPTFLSVNHIFYTRTITPIWSDPYLKKDQPTRTCICSRVRNFMQKIITKVLLSFPSISSPQTFSAQS